MEGNFSFTGRDLLSLVLYGGYALAAGIVFAATLSVAVSVYVPIPELPSTPPIYTQATCEEADGTWDALAEYCTNIPAEEEFAEAQERQGYWNNVVLAVGMAVALLAAVFVEVLGPVLRVSLAFGGLAVAKSIYGLSPFALMITTTYDKKVLIIFVAALLVMWYGAYYLGKVKRVWSQT
ncbi:MAG: hypothetical protein AAB538_02015 [Patescibacteria group bacterium]